MNEAELREWFIYHYDYNPGTGLFRNRISDISVTKKHPKGYIVIHGPYKKMYFAHRVAFLIMEGRWPEQTDHKNRVRDDNRWVNLREADSYLNSWNHSVRKANKSGVTGVEYRKGSGWRAEMRRNGIRMRSKWFLVKEEAVEARKEMEESFFRGEWDCNLGEKKRKDLA